MIAQILYWAFFAGFLMSALAVAFAIVGCILILAAACVWHPLRIALHLTIFRHWVDPRDTGGKRGWYDPLGFAVTPYHSNSLSLAEARIRYRNFGGPNFDKRYGRVAEREIRRMAPSCAVPAELTEEAILARHLRKPQ